LKDNLD